MATYKVLQDIEAEDKLFGPLTLKQFIFAAIFIGLGFIQFTIIASGAPMFLKSPFVIVLLLPMLVFGFLAAPIGQDQPNDIWLLARLRFLLKSHKRIWNQDGMSQLVTITAPKREVHIYSDGLSQHEVKSRLQALASTMDTRGWAVKNVATNMYTQPGYLTQQTESDRLLSPSSLPQDVPQAVILESEDMMDAANNPIAQHLDQLVQASSQSHRQQAITHMKNDPKTQQKPQDYWFANQSDQQTPMPKDYATFSTNQVVAPGTDDAHPAAKENEDEKALGKKLAAQNKKKMSHASKHLKTLQPLHDKDGNLVRDEQTKTSTATTDDQAAKHQTSTSNPAIIGLAHNDDLNVATIARQAQKLSENDDEVVISLH